MLKSHNIVSVKARRAADEDDRKSTDVSLIIMVVKHGAILQARRQGIQYIDDSLMVVVEIIGLCAIITKEDS